MSLAREGTSERMLAVLDPRRLLNGIYVGRLVAASGNFVWALLFALFANPLSTVIAASAFVVAMALTAVSYIRTEVNRQKAGPGFLYLQFVHDLLLITVIVHLTGGGDSQFAALYILVNAMAALLLPIGSSLLLAMLGSVLYVGDAFLVSGGDITIPLLLQLVVFVLVVVGTSYIAGRLQEAGLVASSSRRNSPARSCALQTSSPTSALASSRSMTSGVSCTPILRPANCSACPSTRSLAHRYSSACAHWRRSLPPPLIRTLVSNGRVPARKAHSYRAGGRFHSALRPPR